MKRSYIKNLKAGTCLVKGYIEKIRDQKTMQFVVLRDVTGSVQITVVKNEKPQLAEIVSKLTTHSFIDVEGECVNAPQVKLGGLEILPTKIVVQSVADMIPIAEDSSPDIRMDYRWIDLRSEKNVLIFQIGTAFEKHCVDWFVKNDFIGIHTPKITAISSEGGSEVFEIKNYFGQKAYLTQSPQLYKQMSMCAGFDRTFEIADCFRADPSFTSRHATEFTAIDVEMAHIESHHDVMDCQEELIRYALKMVQQEYGQRYKQVFEKDMITISDNKFPRIPLLEVYEILEKQKGYTVPRALKGDLDPEGERLIAEYVKEKYNSDFVFVIDFPAKARAFYTKRHENNPELGKCYDLLFKGLEITSGAQREHRPDALIENIKDKGINPENMKEYVDFFRYGAPAHGGFGFGVGRILFKLFDLPGIKDATFVFRGPTRLLP